MARSRLITPKAADVETLGGSSANPTAEADRPGFRTDRSGLYVPGGDVRREELKATSDDVKHLERAIRNVVQPLWLKIAFACGDPACPDPRIERLGRDDGGFTFRCGCRDRIFQGRY